MNVWGTNVEYFTADEVGSWNPLTDENYQSMIGSGLLLRMFANPNDIVSRSQDGKFYYRLSEPVRLSTARPLAAVMNPDPDAPFEPSFTTRQARFFRNDEIKRAKDPDPIALATAQGVEPNTTNMMGVMQEVTANMTGFSAAMRNASGSLARLAAQMNAAGAQAGLIHDALYVSGGNPQRNLSMMREFMEADLAQTERRIASWMASGQLFTMDSIPAPEPPPPRSVTVEEVQRMIAEAPVPPLPVLANGGMLTADQSRRFVEALQSPGFGTRVFARTATGRTSSRQPGGEPTETFRIRTGQRRLSEHEIPWVLELTGNLLNPDNIALREPTAQFFQMVYSSGELFYADELTDEPPSDEALDQLIVTKVIPKEYAANLRLKDDGTIYYQFPMDDFDLRWLVQLGKEESEMAHFFCVSWVRILQGTAPDGPSINDAAAIRQVVRELAQEVAKSKRPNDAAIGFLRAVDARPKSAYMDYSPSIREYNRCTLYRRNHGRRAIKI